MTRADREVRMPKETRYPPWMCSTCGYMMDAASHMTKNVAPKEDDLSVCLNCGALYVMRSGKWKAATPDERGQIPDNLKREIMRIEIARRLVIDRDLSKRGGRA
jgi:hypothetical protein